MSKLSEHFGHDILVLSGAGVASILSFRSKASSVLKLVANDEDDDDATVSKVAKLIAAETKTLKHDKSKYQTRVSLENSLDDASQTLLHLLSLLSTKLNSTLPAAMIGNIVTSIVTNRHTSLYLYILLRGTIVHMDSHDSLMKVLDNKSQESRTTKLWVENLIKPVMLMMMFVRAEREADWPLHLFCVKEMMRYFFAAGHFNYARYEQTHSFKMIKYLINILYQNS